MVVVCEVPEARLPVNDKTTILMKSISILNMIVQFIHK